MSAERPVEPTLVQHVEGVRDELRMEQRSLEDLSRENARLRAELERLEARKQELHSERGGSRAPRLPEALSAPFDVQVQKSLLRRLAVIPGLGIPTSLHIFIPEGWGMWPYVLPIWGVLALVVLAKFLAPERWRFGPDSLREFGYHLRKHDKPTPYHQIHDVTVVMTPAQKRRGVGSLIITHKGSPPELMVRNVPEPERLAEWLRAQRDTQHK